MLFAQADATVEVVNDGSSSGIMEYLSYLWEEAVQLASTKGLDFLMNLIGAVVILVIGMIVIKIVSKMVHKVAEKSSRGGLLADFITSVITKSMWAVLAVMVLGRLGVDVGPLIAGLGVTGFIVGFAFQESLGNLASGMMIALNQPFKVGDFINAAGIDGSVLKLDMMATTLATPDNKKVVLPNKSVWGAAITNFSALGKRRVDLAVSVSYGSDLEKAKEVIRDTVKGVAGVLVEPAPTVEVRDLSSSSVTIAVRPWSSCDDYWAVYFATQQSVKEALDKAGIEIPFPQMVVHQAK